MGGYKHDLRDILIIDVNGLSGIQTFYLFFNIMKAGDVIK